MSKKRVDSMLHELGFFATKDAAERAVMAGIVYNHKTQERITHAGMQVKEGAIVFEIKGKQHPYVSRGGIKLAGAMEHFNIDFKDKVVLDIGSSTGGFTDCALQNGAKHVYALDVGTNQLAWKLRSDARVTVLEQTNFREATKSMFDQTIDILVTDVSFISLKVILDKVAELFAQSPFQMVALVKPQFEVQREDVGQNGIIHDAALREAVLEDMQAYIAAKHWEILGTMQSPITGAKGNIEYLVYFEQK